MGVNKVPYFANMTPEEMDAWSKKLIADTVKQTLTSMGIDDPEDGPNLKELVIMLKNYKAAKKTAALAVRSFAKNTVVNFFKNISQIGAIIFFLYLITIIGLDKDKLTIISSLLNVRPPQ